MDDSKEHKQGPRVAVTGVGIVSPIGLTAQENWDSLLAGRSGIDTISQFDAGELPVQIAGEVRGFDPQQYMERKDVRRSSRGTQLITAALSMALTDADLPMPLPDPERSGTVVGTGAGGLEIVDRELIKLRTKGFSRVSPFALTAFLPNMPSYHVSLISGAKGPINTVVAACASGSQAIAEGVEFIRRGRADIVVVGGVEGLIHETSIASFARMGALSQKNDDPAHACRPFDRERDGTVISEGAGVLILERLDMAQARRAHVYGEILGHACSSDAFHVATPDPEAAGAVRAMRWALEDAGVRPENIDYINAHGTATPINDSQETLAIKTLFGERAYQIPISSSKAVLGHAMGATGAIEAIFCLYALQENRIPPTWNYTTPDPACDLDYVPNRPRDAQLQTVLSNSFAMGGHNTALVFGKIAANGADSAADIE